MFLGYAQRYKKPGAFPACAAYAELARAHGLTPTQLALAFCYHRWNVASTIIAPALSRVQGVAQVVTFGEQRTKRWPQVPTLKELGHHIVATSPYGLAAPAGVPPAIVQVLHEAFKAAMNDPAFVAELARYDQELAYLGPEDYGKALRAGYEAERKIVDRLGLAWAGAQLYVFPLLLHRPASSPLAVLREAGYNGEPVVHINPSDFPAVTQQGRVTVDLMRRLGVNIQAVESDWASIIARRANRAPPAQGGWNLHNTNGPAATIANPVFFDPKAERQNA